MLDVEMEEALASAGPSSSHTAQHSQLHLRVERTLSTASTDRQIYLVLDTNVLITNLEIVQRVYTRLKGCPNLTGPRPTKKQAKPIDAFSDDPLHGNACLLVPYVVLDELDRLKMKHLKRGHAGSSIKGSFIGGSAKPMLTGKNKSPSSSLPDNEDSLALSMHNPNKSRKGSRQQADLNQSAREAISWLFETLRREEAPKKKKGKPENNIAGGMTRTIRFQKRDEKMGAGILELPSKADTQIMDCCRFFSSAFHGSHQVVLWTGDKHLRLQAEVHDVLTIGNGQKTFSQVLNDVVERLTSGREKSINPAKDTLLVAGTAAGPESIHQPNPLAGSSLKRNEKEKVSSNKQTESARGNKAKLPRTVPNIDRRLSQIIPLQLYSFLLERLFDSKPVELRAFLTPEDPGPGAWDVRHCLHLYKRAWSRLSAILPQDRAAATSEAILWLEGFLTWYSDPLREDMCPAGSSLFKTERDEMHIDDDGRSASDDVALRSNWEQAKEAIVLIFRPCLDQSACVELEAVLRWMTSDDTADK